MQLTTLSDSVMPCLCEATLRDSRRSSSCVNFVGQFAENPAEQHKSYFVGTNVRARFVCFIPLSFMPIAFSCVFLWDDW